MSPTSANDATILRGVHTGTANQSTSDQNQLPSIFDILAQESLTTSLKPGLKSIFKFIRMCYPHSRRLQMFDRFFDEIYTTLNLTIENHYLSRYSASFSENFYSMKRVMMDGNQGSLSTFRQRIRSLFFIVLIPYLSEKLETFMEKLRSLAPQRRSWLSELLLRVYPHMKTIIMAVIFLFHVGYTFSLTNIPSPFHWLQGVKLERLTPEDIRAFETVPLHLNQSGLLSRLWRILLSIPSILGRLFSYGLFLCQFLEYFYTDDTLAKQLLTLTKPQRTHNAPPHPYKLMSENYVLSMDVSKCPLCYRTRDNDTALSVSGYVFCYGCINDFVRREGRCPITSLPAGPDDLVRIYQSHNIALLGSSIDKVN